MTTYYRRFVAVALFALFTLPTFAEEVNFIRDNVRVAIDRAAAEGKLVFIDFWADYCSPCKLMEKYTFTDPSVIDKMNSSYVPVRINIETFDGYDLKAQYNVKLLPTIIVLNSKGKLVARFEESMSGSKLLAVLAKYDTKKNRAIFEKPKESPVKEGFSPDFDIVAKPNAHTRPTPLPVKVTEKPMATPAPVTTATPRSMPKENTNIAANNAVKPATNPTFKAPVYGRTAPTNATTSNNMPSVKPTKVADVPTGYNNVATPRRAVSTVEKTTAAAENTTTSTTTNSTIKRTNTAMETAVFTKGNFTIQVGNFASKDNASRMSGVMKIQVEGKQKVFLISGGTTESTTHRVMVGGFKTHKEATEFKKKNQINGFVQSFAAFMK